MTIRKSYRFLTGPDDAGFCQKVSDALAEGYVLYRDPAVAEMAHAAGALVVIDNVLATPIAQKPLELGADIVIYSTTKHIDGPGRVLGGAVLADEEFIREGMLKF